VSLSVSLDLVAELGAGWYRFDCNADSPPRGPGRFDHLVAQTERRHVRLLPDLFFAL